MTRDRRLEQLAALVEQRLGVDLTRAGLDRALERHARRSSEQESPDALPLGSETFQSLVDAVTVQHSWFFRDRQQLEIACDALHRRATDSSPRQVWVPACATGEDVYSVVSLCRARKVPVQVLGTDVNRTALEHSRRGRYGADAARHVPAAHASLLGPGPGLTVAEDVRRSTRFELHNLLEAPPTSSAPDGKWNLILCRNVLIYFTAEQRARAIARMRDALSPGGVLVLGASDVLTSLPEGLMARLCDGRVLFERATDRGLPAAPRRDVSPAAASSPRWGALDAPAAATPRAEGSRAGGVGAPAPAGDSLRDGPAPLPETEAPSEGVSHMTTGIRLQLEGDLHAAFRELRAALFLDPTLWLAAYYLALVCDELGRDDDAQRAYAQVLEHVATTECHVEIDGHDTSFLRRDVATIAQRRTTRRAR